MCGRHATAVLELWGRRRRPLCQGDCGKAHPTLSELEAAIAAAVPRGRWLHAHRVPSAPNFGDEPSHDGSRNLYVVPSHVTASEADAALDMRAPMTLRVAIDIGYDHLMGEGERKSLASQCGLCHGIASQAEHRPHVALAICCGTPDTDSDASEGANRMALRRGWRSRRAALSLADREIEADWEIEADREVATAAVQEAAAAADSCGRGSSTFALLRTAGLESWPLAWKTSEGRPLSLLALPGVSNPSREIVYLSPDAPDMLTHLSASEVYVIGGLVDRVHVPNASRTRAISLGVRSAQLPLL